MLMRLLREACAAGLTCRSLSLCSGMTETPLVNANRSKDAGALKRLLREAFAELTDHSGRLYTLERSAASGAGGGWATGADLDPSAAAEITFFGAIEAAPALVLSQVPARICGTTCLVLRREMEPWTHARITVSSRACELSGEVHEGGCVTVRI